MITAEDVAGSALIDSQIHIKRFNDRVKYMASKAKPKRVSLKTLETGETVYFLCKQARSELRTG